MVLFTTDEGQTTAADVMPLKVKVPTSVTSGDVPVVLKVGTKLHSSVDDRVK